MKQTLKWLIIAMIAAVIITLSACGPKNSTEPFGGSKSGPTEAQAMAGASDEVQAVFKQQCLSCHAANLEGKVGPKTNLQQVGSRLTKEQILNQINNGGNGMPAYGGKLKQEEKEALAAWLAGKK